MSDERWPRERLSSKDKFLDSNQPDTMLNACVGRQLASHDGPRYYWEGFRSAANHLAFSVVTDRHEHNLYVDLVVYPLFFLYRHSFELQLKLLIRTGRSFLFLPEPLKITHSLQGLWSLAMPLIEKALPDANWSQNGVVTRLINELSTLDPRGQASRYDVSDTGEKHFKNLSIIHVRHFAEMAEKLSDYLEEIQVAIEHLIDLRNEHRGEHAD